MQDLSERKTLALLTGRFIPNEKQIDNFKRYITKFPTDEFKIMHSGTKPDLPFHAICRALGYDIDIIRSPQKEEIEWRDCNVMEVNSVKDRNQMIVTSSDSIIATPQAWNEYEDSYLWKCIRDGIQQNKEVYCISPNGGYVWKWVK